MRTTGGQRVPPDWTRGAARAFATAVVLLLVGMGVWIDRSNQRAASEWVDVGQSVSIAEMAAGSERSGAASRQHEIGAISEGMVDLNRATAAQLELLPGIGPASAARIVAYREQIGGFRSVDELDGVSGIGSRTMERLRPLLRVGLEPVESGGTSASPDGR